MDKKQAYIEKLDAQLRKWAAEIDELKAKTDKAKAEQKAEYQQTIEKLREKQNAVKTSLKNLKESSGEAWESFKEGVDRAETDLKAALERAINKFRQ